MAILKVRGREPPPGKERRLAAKFGSPLDPAERMVIMKGEGKR